MSTPMDVRIIRLDRKIVDKIFIVERSDNVKDIINSIYDIANEQIYVYLGTKKSEFNENKMREIGDLSITLEQLLHLDDYTKLLVIISPAIEPERTETNAFSPVMNAGRKLSIPEKKNENSRKADLYNAVVDYLTQEKVGFFAHESIESTTFMVVIVNALWTIDGHVQKLESICGNDAVPKRIRFNRIFRRISHESHVKKSVPNLKKTDIVDAIVQIEKLCGRKFIQSPLWINILEDVQGLLQTLVKYNKHLQQGADKRTEQRQLLEPNVNRTTNKLKTPPFPLAHTRARAIIWCSSCNFPRLIYSQQKLTAEDMECVDDFIEKFYYICGVEIPMDNVYINKKDVCNLPISKHYFDLGEKLKGFKSLCYKCSAEDPTKQSKFKKLLICNDCYINESKLKHYYN